MSGTAWTPTFSILRGCIRLDGSAGWESVPGPTCIACTPPALLGRPTHLAGTDPTTGTLRPSCPLLSFAIRLAPPLACFPLLSGGFGFRRRGGRDKSSGPRPRSSSRGPLGPIRLPVLPGDLSFPRPRPPPSSGPHYGVFSPGVVGRRSGGRDIPGLRGGSLPVGPCWGGRCFAVFRPHFIPGSERLPALPKPAGARRLATRCT